MYYSSPFKHQERGSSDKRREWSKDGKLTKEEQEESISGMLTNFSKALGEYKSSLLLSTYSFAPFVVNLQRLPTIKTRMVTNHPSCTILNCAEYFCGTKTN